MKDIKPTIIWSKDSCPYCEQAKELLTKNNIQFEERRIGVDYTKKQLLEAIPDAKTVPQIIINGEYIGGYSQLKQKLKG